MQPMNKADHTLPDDISELHKLVHKLQAKVGWYEEQFRLSQHKRFPLVLHMKNQGNDSKKYLYRYYLPFILLFKGII